MKTSFSTVLVLALVVACSGGGGSDSGGIGGTGFSQGAVTDVSMSARVTGTLWEFDDATEFEPATVGEDDLQIGQVVLIEGIRGDTNLATRVVFDDIIEGPVTGLADILPLSAGLRAFMILDRRVIVSNDMNTTALEPDTLDLMNGQNVRVSGFEGPDGIAATRIEFVDNGDDVGFRGPVSDLDLGAGMFDIGDVQVSFEPGDLGSSFDGTNVMEGDFVQVVGVIPDDDSLDVDASLIELRSQGIEDSGDLDDVEIEGVVTDFVNLGSFRVAGQLATTFVEGVQFEPANSAFVQNGARIEVEGSIRSGVLRAERVKLRNDEVQVDAAGASDVDVTAGTFTLAGVDFMVDSSTRFEGDDFEGLADLDGCFVKTRGIQIASVVLATRVKCEADGDAVRIRARVEGLDALARTFDLLGMSITTDMDTSFDGFPDVGNEDEFYLFLAANPGQLVETDDLENDGDLTTFGVADEVEREEAEDDD